MKFTRSHLKKDVMSRQSFRATLKLKRFQINISIKLFFKIFKHSFTLNIQTLYLELPELSFIRRDASIEPENICGTEVSCDRRTFIVKHVQEVLSLSGHMSDQC